MQPSIGRIVHYKHNNGMTVPAMICGIKEDKSLHLTLFVPAEMPTPLTVGPDAMAAGPDTAEVSQWWWPERIGG